MRYFPDAPHDDGPDALEMALTVVGELGWELLDLDAPRPAPTRCTRPP